MASETGELIKMSELARRAGVARGTIQHYLREGLLPRPVKTFRNMAYYDRRFIDRIRCIKELQQKRYLPLDVIKAILERDSAQPAVISPNVSSRMIFFPPGFSFVSFMWYLIWARASWIGVGTKGGL